MHAWLAKLSPGQKKALMVGIPAVVLLVVFQRLTGQGAPIEDAVAVDPDAPGVAPGGMMIPGYEMPSTDAIGTGALTDFLSQINANQSGFLADLAGVLGDQETAPVNTPPTPTTPPTPGPTPRPTPAPAAARPSPHDGKGGTRWSYVIGNGETLGQISARLYGTPNYWKEIWYLNANRFNAWANAKGQKITSASFRLVPTSTDESARIPVAY